ncbi:protein of unknown function [Candidatus Nitrosocosmicus franklandus]|uniref:Uncharacterized protein n=1 Tax=Candidatus Nitrosocosmicus franklandianus TaxID=1798806 RepID=A0A484IA11_9ARCH|nr:protein of unknown function [Candidatus Nitrosocosmicus franklandus]
MPMLKFLVFCNKILFTNITLRTFAQIMANFLEDTIAKTEVYIRKFL